MSALAWFLSFATGFLSLAQETGWARLLSFVFETLPHTFGFLLFFYLLGLSVGAAWGKRICQRQARPWAVLAWVFVVAGALDWLLPLAWARLADVAWVRDLYVGPVTLFVLLGGAFVFLSAAVRGVAFPIVHQLGTQAEGERIGRTLSYTYAFNVLGATLGPLVATFALMDHFGSEGIFAFNAAASVAIGLALLLFLPGTRPVLTRATGMVVLAAWATAVGAAGLWASDRNPQPLSQAFAIRQAGHQVNFWAENRHGIVHTLSAPGRDDDIVYGGNVYDGRLNIDLVRNSNGIHRAYVVPSFHPEPRRLLVVGLSSGSWLKVIAADPRIEVIDVVEINSAYVDLIRSNDLLRPVLDDPRVTVHIADGRRWLLRHPERMYDMVVMNTSFHWRALATNLLSADFLTEVRRHLADERAFIYYNTTNSPDVYQTAAHVFPYAFSYGNFVVASDSDIRATSQAHADVVWTLRAGSQPLLNSADLAVREAVQKMYAEPMLPAREKARELARRPAEVITDNNMVTEFRHGRSLGTVR